MFEKKSDQQDSMQNNKAREFGYKVGNKLGLAHKLKKMQEWIDEYPKTTAFSLLAFVSLMSIMTMITDLTAKGDSQMDRFAFIEESESTFEMVREVQAKKKEEGNMLNTIGQTTIALKEEFDSLTALPAKSREDSARIYEISYKLNYIIKEINNSK